MHKEDYLKMRAPETRSVLRQIEGRFLNWGILLFGIVFCLLILGASQLHFTYNDSVSAKVLSPTEIVVTGRSDNAGEINVKWKDETYPMILHHTVGEQTFYSSHKRLPKTSEYPYEANFLIERKAKLFAVLFKGIL